mmetsp:Transcript_24002/g.36876  ORF Transcript_24002/g.36876 Transcript_24002/m.36876 type:complete len:331 (-) Transcript_24002:24-1016(-)
MASEEVLGVDDFLALDTSLLALLLELLWGSGENGEGAEVHRNNLGRSRQEFLHGVRGLVRAHSEAVSDGEHGNIRFVQRVDQLHVGENVGVSGMVDSQVVARDLHDITASASSRYLDSLGTDASRGVVGSDHGDLGETEILGASLLHLGDELAGDLPEQLVVGADLGGADNLSLLALARHDEEGGVHGVIELSVGDQGQVAVVRALFLLLLGAVLVIDPNIDVDVSVNLLLVQEAQLEAGVAEPLDVKLSLQLVELQRALINFLLHLLGLLNSLNLLGSQGLSVGADEGLSVGSDGDLGGSLGLGLDLGLFSIIVAVELGNEVVKFLTHL